MNEMADHHDRWHDEIAAYALHSMDEREAALVEQHLHECGPCAERFRWLAPAIDVIPASVAQQEPPPELRERLMAIVREEAAEAGEVPSAAGSARERRWRWLPSFEGIALRPALAGAAAFLLLVAGVAGYELSNETSPSGSSVQIYEASSAIEGSTASGTLKVNGDEGSLRVANLLPTRKGDVYQAWIVDNEGSVHPSSVFVLSDDRTGVVSIPAGLSNAHQVIVTREPKGGSDSPHEAPLIAANLN